MRRLKNAPRGIATIVLLAIVAVVVTAVLVPTTAFGKKAKIGGNPASGRCKAKIDNLFPKVGQAGKTVLKITGSNLNAGRSNGTGEAAFSKAGGGFVGTSGDVVGHTLFVKIDPNAVSGPIYVGSSECAPTYTKIITVNP
jgi:hypothetical protein